MTDEKKDSSQEKKFLCNDCNRYHQDVPGGCATPGNPCQTIKEIDYLPWLQLERSVWQNRALKAEELLSRAEEEKNQVLDRVMEKAIKKLDATYGCNPFLILSDLQDIIDEEKAKCAR